MEKPTKVCTLIEFLISGESVTDYFFDDAILEDTVEFSSEINKMSSPKDPILISTSDYSFFTGEMLFESQALHTFAFTERTEEIIKFTTDFFKNLGYDIQSHVIQPSEATEDIYQDKYETMENALIMSDIRTKIIESIKATGKDDESSN